MITILTKDNFENEIKTGNVVVKFSVKKWCKYCDEFKSHYELASESGASTQNWIKYCEYIRDEVPKSRDDYDEIENKYEVTSFPAVIFFENGECKWPLKRYRFYSDRFLQSFILDEQKKLFTQQCYVEDLLEEQQLRRVPQWIPEMTPIPPNVKAWTKK